MTPSISSAHRILKHTFGYERFRPLQLEVIQHVLQGRDALVIMPTGGGKSLCFQIPALVFEGLTVVVSPLISLMRDQVEALKEVGVAATFLNSSLSSSEYLQTIDFIRSGTCKLLYVAPETLLQERVIGLLTQYVQVDCLTIDEAHCISEWGHDFRPEYRHIADVRRSFPKAVCVALTATATQQVRTDIEQSLELAQSETFLGSFDRPNLFLEVRDKLNLKEQLLAVLKDKEGQSGIIYTFSRKSVESISEFLNSQGWKAKPYHAGLSDTERSEHQDAFIRDDIQLIVATIAFGMGIDKPDVRFVIHTDLPKSIESYYQQIGRAGRDGLPSECTLFFSFGDVLKVRHFIDQKDDPERQVALAHLEQMLEFAQSVRCRRKYLLRYFGETYPESTCDQCDNCVRSTENERDFTVEAQKFLSCMIRTGQRFGAGHVIDVLRGSKAKKVLQHQHDTLSTHGIGKEYPTKVWTILARELLRKGLIQKEPEYGVLSVTSEGNRVLKGEASFSAWIEMELIQSSSNQRKSNPQSQALSYDTALFNQLKTLRKSIADSKKVPPYVVFSDKSLIEMAYYFPQNEEDFKAIHGVGKQKVRTYGEQFISLITDYAHSKGVISKSKTNSPPSLTVSSNSKKRKYQEVGEAMLKGASMEALVEHFKVKPSTIIQNLQTYADEGGDLPVQPILDSCPLSVDQVKEIVELMEQQETITLKPIFEQLNQKVSYEVLHQVKLLATIKRNRS